jgi:hypothetical protein
MKRPTKVEKRKCSTPPPFPSLLNFSFYFLPTLKYLSFPSEISKNHKKAEGGQMRVTGKLVSL